MINLTVHDVFGIVGFARDTPICKEFMTVEYSFEVTKAYQAGCIIHGKVWRFWFMLAEGISEPSAYL